MLGNKLKEESILGMPNSVAELLKDIKMWLYGTEK